MKRLCPSSQSSSAVMREHNSWVQHQCLSLADYQCVFHSQVLCPLLPPSTGVWWFLSSFLDKVKAPLLSKKAPLISPNPSFQPLHPLLLSPILTSSSTISIQLLQKFLLFPEKGLTIPAWDLSSAWIISFIRFMHQPKIFSQAPFLFK